MYVCMSVCMYVCMYGSLCMGVIGVKKKEPLLVPPLLRCMEGKQMNQSQLYFSFRLKQMKIETVLNYVRNKKNIRIFR